ncbi:Pr6Pr family membrane protein [Marinoscillum sp.]|uniref:Pr6Pr family membrane protein n=1 Tax=Marinoscillum sp. TaxID=2024838 RepID=UPI003BA8996D
MRKKWSTFLAVLAWVAVLTQYFLMLENRVASVGETTIRFFSFFTILTNSLVAIYFTMIVLRHKKLSILSKPGTLTAVTVYITIVGLVYQIVLRPVWEPTGVQLVVDELLHSLIPIVVIVCWYLFEDKSQLAYRQIPKWLIYPLVYLVYILIRGDSAGFYPYPFVDVESLGLSTVLMNAVGLIILFVGMSALYIKVGRVITKK